MVDGVMIGDLFLGFGLFSGMAMSTGGGGSSFDMVKFCEMFDDFVIKEMVE